MDAPALLSDRGASAVATLRREWPWWIAALLGVAVISYAGLRGFARSDYEREAAGAFGALLHGHILGFFELVPAYGGSLILRAPFAGAVALLGGGELAVYRAVSIPCLVAVALVGLVLVRRMGARGATTAERGLVLALCVANPVTVRALYIGHPEELLCAAFAIGAVIAASDRRSILAGILLGLAIATKAWAVLAIGPVLLALPGRRLLALAIAGAITAVVLAPIALFAPQATTLVHAASTTGEIFNPWQVWWMLGDGGHTVRAVADGHLLSGYRLTPPWLSPLTHPLIAALMFPLSLLWLRARGAAPRVQGEQLLGLLALLLLLRCALDPWNCVYYELPFLFTLLAWEALARPDHEPVLTFLMCAVVWVTFEVLPSLVSPDLQSAFFVAWTLALGGWLARELFAPRGEDLERARVGGTVRASRVWNLAQGTDVCERCIVADRPLPRMRGLLGRRDLPAGEGLLLAPAGSIHTHFMRFPIDAVFLDRASRVVGVHSAIGPWRMARRRGAKAVLELRAGEAQQRGIEIGDVLRLMPVQETRHA